MMKVVRLLRNLIEIPSPYGSEGRLASFLLGYIKGLGFNSASIDGAGNIILNPDAELWVVTHMDLSLIHI